MGGAWAGRAREVQVHAVGGGVGGATGTKELELEMKFIPVVIFLVNAVFRGITTAPEADWLVRKITTKVEVEICRAEI